MKVGFPVSVITVIPMPAPFNVMALFIETAFNPHVAETPEILIVSPATALLMQACKLAESGVEFQIGELPVQAARTPSGIKSKKERRSSFLISSQFLTCVCGCPKEYVDAA